MDIEEIRRLRARLGLNGDDYRRPPARNAVQLSDMSLSFQPIIDLGDASIVGLEALARWHPPAEQARAARHFVPALSATALRHGFVRWVLGRACAAAAEWLALGLDPPPVTVNVSAIDATELYLSKVVAVALRDTGLPPECLVIEVPDGALAARNTIPQLELAAVRALGVGLSVDVSDFETGPIERAAAVGATSLKIDIPSLGSGLRREAVERFSAEARSLGLAITGKRVGRVEDVALLGALGCQRAQGYSFGEPLGAGEVVALLERRRVRRQATREAPRVSLIAPADRAVRLPAAGGPPHLMSAVVIDLSEHGMQLRLSDHAEIGDEIRLLFGFSAYPDPAELSIEARAVDDMRGTYRVNGRYLSLPGTLCATIAGGIVRRRREAAA